MPKERTKSRNKEEKRGDTRIDTLRRTYGDSFAPGMRGDAHLKTLLDRTGSNSLSDYLKTTAQSQVSGEGQDGCVEEKAPNIRYASDQRFREAHRKTSKLHAGLFRRLAE